MPKLTANQIAELKHVLDTRHALLLEQIRNEVADSENHQIVELLGRMPGDAGDQSVADALTDLNLAMIDHHLRELREIEQGRARLSTGEAGLCTECGERIRFERLVAQPTASRCIGCQETFERTHAQPATPRL